MGLFVHLHALVTDGCFEAPAVADEAAVFRPADGLCEQDLLRALQRLHADLAEHLEGDSEPADEALVACVQLGLPLPAVGPVPCESRPASPMLVRGFGMQLHAAVTGRGRKRLERVCRSLLRPPFALDAVQRTADGQVRVHFKKPNRFGASYAQMTPHAFLARLLLEAQLRDPAPCRLSWVTLLARVFRIDISVCARCSGPMRMTRFVTTPEDIAAELHGARPPPRRAVPGQLQLFSALP